MKTLMLKKYLFPLVGLVSCTSLSVFAADVDFSHSGLQTQSSPLELAVTAVKVTAGNDTILKKIHIGFNQHENTFSIFRVEEQLPSAALLQQLLLNTTWSGKYYSAGKHVYATTLNFKMIQDSLVFAEVKHATTEAEPENELHADLAGYVETQYSTKDEEGETTWVSAQEVEESLSNEEEGDDILLAHDSRTRHLLTLKRTRGYTFTHTTSNWGSHAEYRLVIEGNDLSGSVGTPSNQYGSNSGLKGTGSIELQQETSDNLE